MEISRKACRLCLTEIDFNVSLFGSYCRKTSMLDKILVTLRLPIEENENFETICYKCAENVEKFYDFINFIKKAQTKLVQNNNFRPKNNEDLSNLHVNKRVTSYVREQVFDADYTFSFLEMSKNDEKNEPKGSSPFFSYLSPPALPNSFKSNSDNIWKTPRQVINKFNTESRKFQSPPTKPERPKESKVPLKPRHHSRDLFESQSQDLDEFESKTFDWKLTPDENIIKKVRQNFFGHSDF